MDAFAALGLRTAAGLTLSTSVEPCLMCSATAIAMRAGRIVYAAPDPVFEGLPDILANHSYAADRSPQRAALDQPLLAAVARILPLANRVWSRAGQPPRREWLDAHQNSWTAATELVQSGTLSGLVDQRADVDAVISAMAKIIERHDALEEAT